MPMTDRLIEACALPLERHLEMLFENPVKIPGTGMCELPVVGNLFIPDLEDRSQFMPVIIAALAARAKFYREVPERPILPLRQEDCEALANDDRPQVQVVGLFGDSWRYAGWDRQHPSFRRYCCGLLACDYAPDEIRNDRSLQLEFPPVRLDGLADGWLVWRSDEKIVWDRQHKAWCEGTGPAPGRL
jgi:hypothetical protein